MTGTIPGAGEVTGARRAAVVVLGELGRSPRMQYHALALANEGFSVDLIGYGGRPADAEVAEHPRVRLHELPQPWRRSAPRALWAPVAAADVAAQAAALTRLLLVTLPRADVLLTQNPPSFPTLAVAPVAARARRTRWIVDWHNFGADMLALRLGPTHAGVRAARVAERALGATASGHLCVSAAMRDVLDTRWGIPGARVLRDRPAKRVGRTPPGERKRLFARYGITVDALADDRPAVIVTSSSWTADEDFSLLLDAMVACEAAASRGAALPGLFFLMTGDGPQRAQWEQRFAACAFRHVRTKTVWVDAADYPRLLGAADLGLSLHRSASGVDLPMKIADMFGAGLPVCALDYGPVLAELVRAGENGELFSTGPELGERIRTTLAGFPHAARLEALRSGVERLAEESWADGWRREARALFLEPDRA